MTYIEYPDRETWIAHRYESLGASESAVACGMSHFRSAEDLWEEKTGATPPRDLSVNPNVVYGTKAEEPLRALFTLKHTGEYAIEYHPYRVYRSEERPYMTCTLDGEITRIADGARAIYECKTTLIRGKAMLEEWNGKIPMHYYIQVCHQLYVKSDCDFAILNAELRFPDNSAEIREYEITREECAEDIRFILPKCDSFWNHVKNKTRPSLSMTL